MGVNTLEHYWELIHLNINMGTYHVDILEISLLKGVEMSIAPQITQIMFVQSTIFGFRNSFVLKWRKLNLIKYKKFFSKNHKLIF